MEEEANELLPNISELKAQVAALEKELRADPRLLQAALARRDELKAAARAWMAQGNKDEARRQLTAAKQLDDPIAMMEAGRVPAPFDMPAQPALPPGAVPLATRQESNATPAAVAASPLVKQQAESNAVEKAPPTEVKTSAAVSAKGGRVSPVAGAAAAAVPAAALPAKASPVKAPPAKAGASASPATRAARAPSQEVPPKKEASVNPATAALEALRSGAKVVSPSGRALTSVPTSSQRAPREESKRLVDAD